MHCIVGTYSFQICRAIMERSCNANGLRRISQQGKRKKPSLLMVEWMTELGGRS